MWFSKPTISWASCFCTTNCFHSQSWGETCHPWRRYKVMCCHTEYFLLDESTNTQEAGIWSGWSPFLLKRPLSCCRRSLVWTRLPSGPIKWCQCSHTMGIISLTFAHTSGQTACFLILPTCRFQDTKSRSYPYHIFRAQQKVLTFSLATSKKKKKCCIFIIHTL